MGSHACCTDILDKSFSSGPLFLFLNSGTDGLFIDSLSYVSHWFRQQRPKHTQNSPEMSVFLPPRCSPGQSQAIWLSVPTTVAHANSWWDPISNPFTRLMSSLSFIPLSFFFFKIHLFSKCHHASRGWKSSTTQSCLKGALDKL